MLTSTTSQEITQTVEAATEVHLSKPGGQREGPYTLAQIKHDLTAGKYNDTDYWAWYEGLPDWVPLYALPGVASSDPAPASARPKPEAPAKPLPEPEEDRQPVSQQVSSGMPVSALEQVFMFTTGRGPDEWRSQTVARMLKRITGEEIAVLREAVPRHVVGGCDIGDLLKPNGSISDAVWEVMATRRPDLIQHARERLYRVCVRTFRIESDAIVAVVLFYNKAKL